MGLGGTYYHHLQAILKREAVCSSEILVTTHQTWWFHNPEDHSVNYKTAGYGLQGYDTMWCYWWIQMFCRNMLPPSSGSTLVFIDKTTLFPNLLSLFEHTRLWKTQIINKNKTCLTYSERLAVYSVYFVFTPRLHPTSRFSTLLRRPVGFCPEPAQSNLWLS
jgi:hypothetical protein